MRHESLRVLPGSTIDLAEWPTRSDHAWSGTKDAGKAYLAKVADHLADLQKVFYADGRHRLLVVLQAMDTGGKDSTIRDVFGEMNPQGVRVTSFKQPTERELAHDYLWRVHPHVPGSGEIAIFNRSHYEDVLVVRVESLVPPSISDRRFQHIVDFEQLLSDEGTTIVKIFIHISKEEQKERLQARLDDPGKHWKFSLGDLDTRAKWDEYQAAYAEALSRTSTEEAPWYIIPGDRKWYRKLVIAEIVEDVLEGMALEYPANEDDLSSVEID